MNDPNSIHQPISQRKPLQERSHETVRRILGATSRLLVTGPLDDLTTSRIAQEAGVSVGALYRFFPDKQAVIDAIAVQHIEQFRESMEAKMEKVSFESGPAFLRAIIDAYVEFLEHRPDFRAIAFGQYVSDATRERQTAPGASGPGMVRRFMLESLGMGEVSSLDLRLRVAIETGERLFAFAYQQSDLESRAKVVEELKRLLAGYLFPPNS